MGIGYEDSVVVYNRASCGLMEETTYFGTLFSNVRVEFTQEENQNKTGKEDASVCLLKIPNDGNLPKSYKGPKVWKKLTVDEMLENFTLSMDGDFFIIVKKKSLALDIEVPVGKIESSSEKYNHNFFEYMKENYGYVFSVNSFGVFDLIPRYEVGGR